MSPHLQQPAPRKCRPARIESVLIGAIAFLAAAFIVSLYIRLPLIQQDPALGPQLPLGHGSGSKSETLGAVACSAKECSSIGTDVLRNNGNAVDAAVATELCLAVIGMEWTGLGGGGYALVRLANGSYSVVDFREIAPAAAHKDMYSADTNASVLGGLSIGVPGELRGLEHMHKTYGSLPWKSLVMPAVQIARRGFVVSKDLASHMDEWGPDSFLSTDPTWAIDFAPRGVRLRAGDIMTRERLANFLEVTAVEGADAFYVGKYANATVRAIQQANGVMTVEDIRRYEVVNREPLSISYRDYRIVGCGAPAGGSVALSAMKIVEGFLEMKTVDKLNISTYHLDQAMRFAFGQRVKLGDPTFVDGVSDYEFQMLSEHTASGLRNKISDTHTLSISEYNPSGLRSADSHGTSHLVTADNQGMAVSLTSTINLGFGSHIMVPETGIILNNEMNDFSLPNVSNEFDYPPTPANFIAPGKRPLSSMTPVIVEFLRNGTLYFATGAAGGSRIITSTIESLFHVLDLQINLSEAALLPRFHDQMIPDEVIFEQAYNAGTIEFFKNRGLNTTTTGDILSYVHSLLRHTNGTFEAAADPRLQRSGGYTT